MKIAYLPVLGALRELYLQPRNMQRLRNYISALTGGTDDVVVPIGVANPMAKEHALAKIDELLALGVEDNGAKAAEEAGTRLAAIRPQGDRGNLEIKTSIVLA